MRSKLGAEKAQPLIEGAQAQALPLIAEHASNPQARAAAKFLQACPGQRGLEAVLLSAEHEGRMQVEALSSAQGRAWLQSRQAS